ncbi:luminal-binding protein-like [Panicum miliaceum]|uniref:Luminal-binding protein-like n=1 Tax=Panicum miliaceum TaxID=4540 RepID=A0A3L6R7C1_PANMI|nr:luminal-binding protein-like [Panicum miliaceum]
MTVPQHFSEASMQDAENAAKIAGLEIVDMVSEPVAVAVAYDLSRKLRKGGNALVLHVGGVTAFASVVTVLMDGSLGILSHRNDPFLGGDDFDQRIVDYFAKLVKMKHGKDISEDLVALGKLRAACERAKKALSDQDHAQVTVKSLLDGVDFSQPFSRSEFEELNDDTFRRVVALVRRVMLEAERRRRNNNIDEILLVGGSTKIPKIQRLIKDYFNGNEPNIRLETDEAVALGAVVHTYSSD